MSKHTEKYQVDARVYYIDIKTKQAKISEVTAELEAYNKGNARKRAYKNLKKLPDVTEVVIGRTRKAKITT